MDTAEFKRPIVEVPGDDGSIDRAINDLDARITDWVTAMTEAQRWVIQRAAEPAPPAATAEPAATGEPEATGEPVAESATGTDTAAEQPGKEKAGLRVGHLKTEPEVPTGKAGIRVFGAEEAPPEPGEPAVDEDEELLATLDPKVAKQIKIKRRLSNGTKSIRELLAEGN